MKPSLMWLFVFLAQMALVGMTQTGMPSYGMGASMGTGTPTSYNPGMPVAQLAPPAAVGQSEAALKNVRDKLVGHKQQLQSVKGMIKSFVRTRKANLPDQQTIKKMVKDAVEGIVSVSASVKESVLPDPVELKQLVSSIKKSKDAAAVKVVQDWLNATLAKGHTKTSEAITKLNQKKIDEAVQIVSSWLKTVAKSFGGGLENTSEQLDGWFGKLEQDIDDLDKVASGQAPIATVPGVQPVSQPLPMPTGQSMSTTTQPMSVGPSMVTGSSMTGTTLPVSKPAPASVTTPVTPPPSPMPSGPGAPVKR